MDWLGDHLHIHSVKMDRNVNVLFGLNGSGKTSILRILHSAMRNDGSLLFHVPFSSAKVVIYSESFKKCFTYSLVKPKNITPASVDYLDNWASSDLPMQVVERRVHDPDFHYMIASNSGKPFSWECIPELPEGSAGRWHHRFLPTSRLVYSSEVRRRRSVSDDFNDIQFEEVFKRHWSEFFGALQLRAREIQQQGLANILGEVLKPKTASMDDRETERDISWQEAFNQVSSFLRRQQSKMAIPQKASFQKQFEESGLLRAVVKRIDRVEKEIAKVMSPRDKLSALIEKMFSGGKKVDFGATSIMVQTNSQSNIGLRALSSGEKQVLRIFLESLQAERSSLIIDEPELSMHIDWQRELIASIRSLNPDAQLIFATHSPEIMAEIDDKHIHHLDG